MSTIASQITSLTIVYSNVYSGVDQRKHQSSASLAFVRGIHRGPVNSPHKGPVTRKMFPFDDVIMNILLYRMFPNRWRFHRASHHWYTTWFCQVILETCSWHSAKSTSKETVFCVRLLTIRLIALKNEMGAKTNLPRKSAPRYFGVYITL